MLLEKFDLNLNKRFIFGEILIYFFCSLLDARGGNPTMNPTIKKKLLAQSLEL